MIVIGVPEVSALNRVRAKLEGLQIPHFAWHEPDGDLGFTAITTVPLDGDTKQLLANYRLYREGGTGNGLQPKADALTNSRVGQLQTSAL
jgi:hypothetical protein